MENKEGKGILTIQPAQPAQRVAHLPRAQTPLASKSSLPFSQKETVRFGQSQHELPAQTSFKNRVKTFLYAPLVYLITRFFTEPRFAQKLAPQKFKQLVEPELAPLLGSIDSVDFKSLDGLALKGHWMPAFRPSPIQSQKTVVMGHGYQVNHRALLEVANGVREMGYNVFLFDFRAHGDSEGTKASLGYHEGKDVASAIQYVKEHYPEQANQLVYYGHSAGAAAIMLTPKTISKSHLEELNDSVDGMILDSPYESIDIEAQDQFQSVLRWEGPEFMTKFLRSTIRHVIEKLKEKAQSHLNLDILFEALRPADYFITHPLSQKPILQYHATKDTTTAFIQGQNMANVLKQQNRKAQWVVLEGAGHYSTTWAPFDTGKQYASPVRGGDVYLQEMKRFLDDVFQTKNRL